MKYLAAMTAIIALSSSPPEVISSPPPETGMIIQAHPDGSYTWECPAGESLYNLKYQSADGTWRPIKACVSIQAPKHQE